MLGWILRAARAVWREIVGEPFEYESRTSWPEDRR